MNTRRKCHNKAVEAQDAQAAWSKHRTKHLDSINERLRHQSHIKHAFENVDAAMPDHAQVFLEESKTLSFEPEPALTDFYVPSDKQK